MFKSKKQNKKSGLRNRRTSSFGLRLRANRKIEKVVALMSILSSLFFSDISAARAIFVDNLPTPTNAMNQIMGDLGVNKNELKNSIQTMNVARLKRQPPQVSIEFNPTDPMAGQKVTAMASPIYFLNNPKDLYFTWYLQTAGCGEDNHPGDDKASKCDLDDDGDVDINDYKIKAARIIANNGFDWDRNGDKEPDNDIYSSDNDDDGYEAVWGGDDQKGKNNHCFVYDAKSGEEYEIECDHHLFAPDLSINDNGDISNQGGGADEFRDTRTVGETNDSFGLNQERFWRTNPNDPDTDDTGNVDEANVAGLGITNFTWVYAPGDKVGVVVEGVSNEPAQSSDSSYKTMWAMPNNDCLSEEHVKTDYPKTHPSTTTTTLNDDGTTTTETTTREEFIVDGTRVEKIATIRTKISTVTVVSGTDPSDGSPAIISGPTTTATVTCQPGSSGSDMAADDQGTLWPCSGIDVTKTIDAVIEKYQYASDLNQCLYDNLIEPNEGGGAAGKLDVSLSYSPDYPMNDPTGEDSDTLAIYSNISNIEDSGFINYTWQVYASDEPNPDSWGSPLLKSELPDSTQTSGIGLNTFQFRLAFSHPQKYFRVKLTAQENGPDGQIREGNSDIIIPISSANEKIRAFNTSVDDNMMVDIKKDSSTGKDMEICREGVDKAICSVVKNQIIGLKVDDSSYTDFSWSINGEPLNYTRCFYKGCNSSKQNNTAFFPVLEDSGYDYTVTLSATDVENGDKINLTKVFEVAEPGVKIVSGDEKTCHPVLLGNYVDVDGKQWPDYSENTFVAASGMPIKLTANYTGFTPDTADYVWYVDGMTVTKNNATDLGFIIDSQNNLVLPGKQVGENYNVAINTLYAPNNQTKKALYTYWNVPYTAFYEKIVADNIDIYSAASISSNQTSQNSTPQKILASIYTSLPSYLAFLFRITLTGILLIFVSRLILSFFPAMRKNEI